MTTVVDVGEGLWSNGPSDFIDRHSDKNAMIMKMMSIALIVAGDKE